MKTQQELLEMIDRVEYADLFTELDKFALGEAYQRLKKEFILKGAVADIDFSDRLKVLVNSILSKKVRQKKDNLQSTKDTAKNNTVNINNVKADGSININIDQK